MSSVSINRRWDNHPGPLHLASITSSAEYPRQSPDNPFVIIMVFFLLTSIPPSLSEHPAKRLGMDFERFEEKRLSNAFGYYSR
jgi:hypothetical protein